MDGHTGPWFEAAIADGYAYAVATVRFTGPKPDVSIERTPR